MNKRFLLVVFLALGFALRAMADSGTQRDLIYLQNGSGVLVSIETYQTRQGWTPVIVSVAGAEASAVMDERGRVVQTWAKGLDKHGLALFTIDLDKGRILLGREAHAILVYEQNPMRIRFRLADSVVQLPVRLDSTGKMGKLKFGGLEIPATISGANVTRTAGSRLDRPAAVAVQSTPKGHRAFAQLTPSRIRARGK